MESSIAESLTPAPVRSREELIYLLSRASELEHGLACVYLFASFSLKTALDEGDVTETELALVQTWKRQLAGVAIEEMLHMAQVANILTAIGGAPHFRRPNFPLAADAYPFGIPLALEPFSRDLIERFVCYEMPDDRHVPPELVAAFADMRRRIVVRPDPAGLTPADDLLPCEPFDVDFTSIGEFYRKIESGFAQLDERRLFIGPTEAQANARFIDLDGQLVAVTDRASACAAIDMIVNQGEAPTQVHPDAHYAVFDRIRVAFEGAVASAAAAGRRFDPVRPVARNPMTRYFEDATHGTLVTDPTSHAVADLFNVAYDTMLLMLLRFFAHTDESDDELQTLSRATLDLMASVLRPLGEALAQLPLGSAEPGLRAGAGFGYNRDVHLLPHKASAWIFFAERLDELASAARTLRERSGMPREIGEASATLTALAARFAARAR